MMRDNVRNNLLIGPKIKTIGSPLGILATAHRTQKIVSKKKVSVFNAALNFSPKTTQWIQDYTPFFLHI